MRKILITGGYGFIGSNLIRYWLDNHPEDEIICLDSVTYAARPDWVMDRLKDDESARKRFTFIQADITKRAEIRKVFDEHRPEHIIHLAAESHVCRSIDGPVDFMMTNIIGTFNLLEEFRHLWPIKPEEHRFHHVSTDEVFGQLSVSEIDDKFFEGREYAPTSPYAASKASSDHIVKAWHHTYGTNVVVTNCSNNFGPNQHEEKLIPKIISAILNKQAMTVYGKGDQIRDWLYVLDHCRAIDTVFHNGVNGESYCVGGELELTNLEVIQAVVTIAPQVIIGIPEKVEIIHTNNRPTDDQRYAVDCSKLKAFGWAPRTELFVEDIQNTIAWYADRILEPLKPEEMEQ